MKLGGIYKTGIRQAVFTALALIFLLLGALINDLPALTMFFCLVSFMISGFSTVFNAHQRIFRGRLPDESAMIFFVCAALFFTGHYIDGAISMLVFQIVHPLRNNLILYARKRDALHEMTDSKVTSLWRILLLPVAVVIDLVLVLAFRLPAGDTFYRTFGMLMALYPTAAALFISEISDRAGDNRRFAAAISIFAVVSALEVFTCVLMAIGAIYVWTAILIDYAAISAGVGAAILLPLVKRDDCKSDDDDI